jgi:hypothetical protein
MKPGERIRLIKESADSLLGRPWSEAQLTLDQFGFRIYDPSGSYEFDEHGYFIDQIKEGSDSNLAGLHEYLLGDDAAPTVRVADQPWGSMPVAMFLSHRWENRQFVGGVKRDLARYGIDAFVAHDDIHPSKQWREVIKAALRTCDAFVAFLDEGFHASQWCDQEIGWALSRGIPIIPVRSDGVKRGDGFLEEHQDVQLGSNSETWIAGRLFQIMVNDPRTKAVGLKALAEAFVNSWSYDTTRRLYGMLEAQETIDAEQLRRMEYAVQTNRQVYETVYGPNSRTMASLVVDLVKKHEPPPASTWYDEEPF